jgi:hypothetical protein
VTSPRMKDIGRVSMYGYAEDTDGHRWKVRFTLIMGPKYSFPIVSAVNEVTKEKISIQRSNQSANALTILNIWPIDFWPEFAKPLALAIGTDGTIQEGLF